MFSSALFVLFLVFVLACPRVVNSSQDTVLAAFTIHFFIFLFICVARFNLALLCLTKCLLQSI